MYYKLQDRVLDPELVKTLESEGQELRNRDGHVTRSLKIPAGVYTSGWEIIRRAHMNAE